MTYLGLFVAYNNIVTWVCIPCLGQSNRVCNVVESIRNTFIFEIHNHLQTGRGAFCFRIRVFRWFHSLEDLNRPATFENCAKGLNQLTIRRVVQVSLLSKLPCILKLLSQSGPTPVILLPKKRCLLTWTLKKTLKRNLIRCATDSFNVLFLRLLGFLRKYRSKALTIMQIWKQKTRLFYQGKPQGIVTVVHCPLINRLHWEN